MTTRFSTRIAIVSLALALTAGVRADFINATTIDYTGATNTNPTRISNSGTIAGYYTDTAGVVRGFERLANGTFSAPIVDPNDNGNSTQLFAVNNSGLAVGSYLTVVGNTSQFHGFTLSGGRSPRTTSPAPSPPR